MKAETKAVGSCFLNVTYQQQGCGAVSQCAWGTAIDLTDKSAAGRAAPICPPKFQHATAESEGRLWQRSRLDM
jgi:hypothetical protein